MFIMGAIQAVLFAFVVWESGNTSYMQPFPHTSMESCEKMLDSMKTTGFGKDGATSGVPGDGSVVKWNALCLPVDEDSLYINGVQI